LLRIPSVRDYFKIEKMLTHAPSALPPKKGFVGGMKECKYRGLAALHIRFSDLDTF